MVSTSCCCSCHCTCNCSSHSAPPVGRLEIIIGPMFAGKTSTLIQRVSQLKSVGYRCLVVTHSIDTRYSNSQDEVQNDHATATSSSSPPAWLSSHLQGWRYPVDAAVSALWDLHQGESPSSPSNGNHHHSTPDGDETHKEKGREGFTGAEAQTMKTTLDWRNYSVIAIDEGQFFPDLYSFCSSVVATGKHVLVASLDGDCYQQTFGEVHRLLPLCESVKKLSAICMKCHRREAFFTQRRVEMSEQIVVGAMELYIAVCRWCLGQERGKLLPPQQQQEGEEKDPEG